MSVETEIQRLQTAKAGIKTAIEEKGVTVGDGRIDTYAEKIKEIAVGGNGLKYASGTVEFADASNCVFYHDLGKIPRFLFIWTEPNTERENACLGGFYISAMIRDLTGVWEDRTTYTTPLYLTSTNPSLTGGIAEITETSAKFIYRNGNYKTKTGVTYNWLVIE